MPWLPDGASGRYPLASGYFCQMRLDQADWEGADRHHVVKRASGGKWEHLSTTRFVPASPLPKLNRAVQDSHNPPTVRAVRETQDARSLSPSYLSNYPWKEPPKRVRRVFRPLVY